MKLSPSVLTLTCADFNAIDALMKRNKETLGFLAKGVLLHHLKSGECLGVKSHDNHLVAYLLFAHQKSDIRVIHLCVDDEARKTGYAHALIEKLKCIARKYNIGVIKLNCRRDYPAHNMWPRFGFIPWNEKPAKTADKRLTQWCLMIDQGEPDLFHIAVSDQKVNAVIDAQIFFHLHDSDDDQTMVSKGLQADFLDDLLQLYITDEMFVEIDRNNSNKQREISRRNAHFFPHANYNHEKMKEFISNLEGILPAKTESQKSDIKQLAKTAASEVNVFLTKDKKILQSADDIQSATGVRVLSPVEVIVQINEIVDPESYISAPLSGSDLVWKKFNHKDFLNLNNNYFLAPLEKKYCFRESLDKSLSQPELWETYGIWLQDELVAIRSMSIVPESNQITVNLCRASHRLEYKLFTKFVIASVLYYAISNCVERILILPHGVAPDIVDDLQDLGFVKTSDGFVRLCPSRVMSHNSLEKMMYNIGYRKSNSQEIEKMCSPVVLRESSLDCFMIPIKPGYTRDLFDINLAKNDIFGAERNILLRWSNVYYRRKSHHRMLRAPARILWYVSSPDHHVVAISHLDTIECGSPKEIFRAYRHMSALTWANVYNMCQGSKVQDIMVLQFSHTYLFNQRVSLDDLRVLYKKNDSNLVLRSPSRVPKALFFDIFQMGYKR